MLRQGSGVSEDVLKALATTTSAVGGSGSNACSRSVVTWATPAPLAAPLLHGRRGAHATTHGGALVRPYFGLIVDGVHNHPYAVNVAWSAHPTGLVLVTDAMQAMGLPLGKHALGELAVEIFDGRAGGGQYEGLHAVLEGTSTLAGAVVPLDDCLRNFIAFTSCSAAQALATVTTHPAQSLGLEHVVGSLHTHAWADMVLLDDAGGRLIVLQTWVAGIVAYTRPREGASA